MALDAVLYEISENRTSTSVGRQVVKIQVLPEYLPAKTTRVPTWPLAKIQVLTWAVLAQVLRYSDTRRSDVIVVMSC